MTKEEYKELNNTIYKRIVEALAVKDTNPAQYNELVYSLALELMGKQLLSPIISKICKYKQNKSFADDLFQEGFLSIVRSIKRFRMTTKVKEVPNIKPPLSINGKFNLEVLNYEPGKKYESIPASFNFHWLARRNLRTDLIRYIKKQASSLNIENPELIMPDNELEQDGELFLILIEEASKAIETLTKQEKEVFIYRQINAKTLNETAINVGVCIENVRIIEKRAINKISKLMEVK